MTKANPESPGQSPSPKRGRPRNGYIDRQIMHLRCACKNGCLSTSDPRAIISVAAGLVAGAAAMRGKAPSVRTVVNFALLYDLEISPSEAEGITRQEFDIGDGWITTDEIGHRLRLTAEDQEHHGLWTLRVHGETAADQAARTEARRAKKVADKKAASAAAKGPFHIDIAKAARHFDLSRPTVYKFKSEWEAALIQGDFDVKFYTFVEARISLNNTVLVAGQRWKLSELMVRLEKSETTVRRWAKQAGTIEIKLAKSAVRRPSGTRKHSGAQPAFDPNRQLHLIDNQSLNKSTGDAAGASGLEGPARRVRR